MKKQILIMFVLMTVTLMLGGVSARAEALSGVTGGIRFAAPQWGVDQGWIRLNVHEVNPETYEAKGQVKWMEYNTNDGWRHVSTRVTCAAFGEDAGEDEQTAVFVVQVISKRGWGPLEPGQYVKFWVHDGGTPGKSGDEWGTPFFPTDDNDNTVPACDYEAPPADYRVPVNGGNLVVHH